MSKKQILIAAVAAFCLVSAVALFRAVERARHDLVTLRVSEMPLAKVLRKISSQTRERIVWDDHLDTRVNLDVKDVPLTEVLNLLAEQAGAVSRTTYAVHGTKTALENLLRILQRGGDPTQSGWTNLSTRSGFGEQEGTHKVVSESGERGSEQVFRSVKVVTRGADGVAHELDLSPERLLLQGTLVSRLPAGQPIAATDRAAAPLAEAMHSRWSKFYTLEALPIPTGGFSSMLGRFTGGAPDPSRFGPGTALNPARMESEIKRRQYERLTRLTPEQRSRQSAQRGSTKVTVETSRGNP